MASEIISDLTINASKFNPSAVTEETISAKNKLEQMTTSGPKWHEVGAAKCRQMRDEGKTPLPPPVYLPAARDIAIPSRDSGRDIPIRMYEPEGGKPSKGLIMHCHGGGFVLGTHQQSDIALERFANQCQLTALSVGYRLAPEHTHPAAANDCIDVAEYLVDHSEERFGAGQKLLFMTGDSAGACLIAITNFALMRSRPKHRLAGIIFNYAQFDVTITNPSVSLYKRPLMINGEAMQKFADAYTPGMSVQQRKDPSVSPLYDDLVGLAAASPTGTLPPAIFHIGTDDPLVDDNILMSAKWQMTGSEGTLKLYPGEPHGFTGMGGKAAVECAGLTVQFVNGKLGSVKK